MSVIISKYENNIDKCWYDSSNIIFSEMIDNQNDYKDVNVTFKDGRTYHYKKVTIQDYLFFKNDISQGKALNKYLASKSQLTGRLKYEFEELENIDLLLLENEKNKVIKEQYEKNKQTVNEEVDG